MGLNLYIKVQKSSIYWWYHFYVGRYYWIKSTMQSCPLILGTKRSMLCCLLMFGGAKCENHVRAFASSARFINVLRTSHRQPQVYWNPYLLLIEGLNHDQWTLLLAYLYVQMVVAPVSPVLIV